MLTGDTMAIIDFIKDHYGKLITGFTFIFGGSYRVGRKIEEGLNKTEKDREDIKLLKESIAAIHCTCQERKDILEQLYINQTLILRQMGIKSVDTLDRRRSTDKEN